LKCAGSEGVWEKEGGKSGHKKLQGSREPTGKREGRTRKTPSPKSEGVQDSVTGPKKKLMIKPTREKGNRSEQPGSKGLR